MHNTLMESLNHQLFLALNAGDAASPFCLWAARILAEWPIGIAVVLALIALFTQKTRGVLAGRLLLTMALAMGTAYCIRKFHYNPRPFVMGLGRMLIEHAPTSSFPSFHATFVFSLALPLLLQQGTRLFSLAIILLGLMTAWARIFAGVHYPLDMAGAFVTAFMAAVVAGMIVRPRQAFRSGRRLR
ncbi:phosphatase PAP2 family protein [Desulfovibrio sp.]|uniref:phosphatase PAP2 family protein n=1 Tax=Desulfovibrio sp. TaxID=885 RepID=UPI0025C18103|nr:phosphatase PAP2 family protein [Desulfovibrio sp.]